MVRNHTQIFIINVLLATPREAPIGGILSRWRLTFLTHPSREGETSVSTYVNKYILFSNLKTDKIQC